MKITWHDTAEDIFSTYWNDEDLSDDEFYGVDDEGNEYRFSSDDALSGIKHMGVWGFADTKNNIIHAWADDKADPETIIHFLAHEVGHLSGEPSDNHIEEEQRAELFGKVAATAYQFYKQRYEDDLPRI